MSFHLEEIIPEHTVVWHADEYVGAVVSSTEEAEPAAWMIGFETGVCPSRGAAIGAVIGRWAWRKLSESAMQPGS